MPRRAYFYILLKAMIRLVDHDEWYLLIVMLLKVVTSQVVKDHLCEVKNVYLSI